MGMDMKRTRINDRSEARISPQTLSQLVGRMQLASRLGVSHGDRDLYKTFGYPESIDFKDYYSHYKRTDIAKAIIKRPTSATWNGDLRVIEVNDAQETGLEKKWGSLMKDLRLKSKFLRLDRLTGIGRYGVLLLGFDDVQNDAGFSNEVKHSSTRKLLYVTPLSEASATIYALEDNVRSSRYGLPKVYEVELLGSKEESKTIRVHHSRIIHVVDDPLENEVYGTPRLEAVFNRVLDLQKLVGGSAEMFWRGARPGYSADVKDNYEMGVTEMEKLEANIAEYEAGLRRFLINEGVSTSALESQVADPTNHVDVQIQMISAVTHIPKRILTGSERGELASRQDSEEWLSYIGSRRTEFAESNIVRPFIDRLIRYGVLPESIVDGYSVEWEDLFSVSDKDKAEVGRIRSEALAKYSSSPFASMYVPEKAFYEFFLGLSESQMELLLSMREEAEAEEVDRLREEAEEDEPEIEPEKTETGDLSEDNKEVD